MSANVLNLLEYYDETTPPYPAHDRISVYPPTQDAAGVAYCGAVKKLRSAVRQPITFLFPSISTSGERKLLAGTQNRLYALNESGKRSWP